ncbi:MAG TPA: hydroxymethylbilane synthase [Candidatus Tyrphobacter sp.]
MLPVAFHAKGRHVVVVGGGEAALRKARSVLAGGFRVVVIAPEVCDELRALARDSEIALHERAYECDDLNGAALAIAATGDNAVDERVVDDARALRIPVCDAGAPERGDFTMLATSRLGDLTIAVESGGASPSFSLRMLREIETHFGPSYVAAARTLARMRTYVRAVVPEEHFLRRSVLRFLAEMHVAELAAMNPSQAEHVAESAIERARERHAPPTRRLVCASRSSALATAQARTIAAMVAQRGIATEILDVTTAGDRDRKTPIQALGEVNVFVKELEVALREHRADYAVHSCKDLPSELAADMLLAAVSAREDPRDAFCSERYERLERLPAGAVVGTSSPRRRRQLEALRPDLRYEDLRGNVDTRLRKLREGKYDAIVLAMAGLNRLHARAAHVVPFSVEEIVPAAAQGALAIETRAQDIAIARDLRAAVNDPESERCVRCERAALRALRAGCSAPVGVHARIDGSRIVVQVAYAVPRGVLRERIDGDAATPEEAEALGETLARRLLPRIAEPAESAR